MTMLYDSIAVAAGKALLRRFLASWRPLAAVALGALLLVQPVLGQRTGQQSADEARLARMEAAGAASVSAGDEVQSDGAHALSLVQPISLAEGAASHPLLSRVISVHLREATPQEAVEHIAARGDLDLAYLREAVASETRITLVQDRITVREALRSVFQEEDDIELLLSSGGHLLLRSTAASESITPDRQRRTPQPQGTIAGTVTDSTTGEPLPGVNVIISGTQQGAATGAEGEYEISGVEPGTYDLEATFIGYSPKVVEGVEVQSGAATRVDFALAESSMQLDEVVAIGYGEQSTRNLSSSVSRVSTEDLEDQPVPQVAQRLQGKVSGVEIKQTTGVPGSGMDIRIRGAASITAGNDPLFVVDGNPIVGGIGSINPNEIESISVLKDAAATSLYGSRAAHGVVIIETKKAVDGETRVDYSVQAGLQQVPQRGRPDMMNAREFAAFQKELAEFRGQPVDPVYQDPSEYGEGTDWYDAIVELGPIQDHTLTLSTGTENFSTTAIAGYSQQDGVVVGSGYERISLRINSSYRPHEKLNIGMSVAPTRSTDTNSGLTDGVGSVINETLQTSPLAPLHDENGELTLTASSPGMFPTPNYVRTQKDRVINNRNTRVLANGFVEYEILEGLTAKTAGYVDGGWTRNFSFHGTTTGTRGVGLYDTPFSSLYQEEYLSWVNENTLEYQFDLGAHNFEVLGGFTAQKAQHDQSSVDADDYPDDKVQTIAAAGTVSSWSGVQEWSLLSYLARVNYDYQGKYLLSASIRRDGSSRFGEENRWGNFPSVSAGWVLTEEGFVPDIEAVSFLKLRASYGVVGNFSIGNYTHIPTISTTNYAFGSGVASGRAVDNLADRGLGWESNRQFNVGVDLSLLDDRIELNYNYYRKNTDDLLYNVSIPQASGFSSMQTNIGELKFWGHEIAVRTENLRGEGLSWTTNLNVSFDRNRVESLSNSTSSLITGPGSGLIGGSHMTKEGYPVGMLYGMVHEGVYVDQEDFDNAPKHSTSQVGTAKFKDVNGDGVITVDDATIIGNPHPDFVFGMTNRVAYNNFDLSVSISGSYGNEVLRGSEQTLANLDGVFNVFSEVQDHWRSPEDPGSGRYGSLASGTTYLERDWWGTQMLYDASHISINNVTVGYSVPVGENHLLRQLRVYGSIQNVHMITSYPGANPQVSQSQASTELGIDGGSYPVPRTYTVGVNVGL